MTYAKPFNPRVDGNKNFRAEFRTPWIVGYLDRARRAGVPEEYLAYEQYGEEALYAELIFRISELCHVQYPDPWDKVQAIHDEQVMLRHLLEDDEYGICFVDASPLIPTIDKVYELQARTMDLRAGKNVPSSSNNRTGTGQGVAAGPTPKKRTRKKKDA